MGHHHHHHLHSRQQKIFILAIALTLAFALIEAVAGLWSHSLALLSDSAHMATDSLALGMAALAAWLAKRPPTLKHSYGLRRAEVCVAWISSALLLILSLAIIIEAITRFTEHTQVAAKPVIIVASIGLVINMVLAWLLSHTEKTLNAKAAILHVISDLLGSIAALIAGIVIYVTHWQLIDPILSIFISMLILFSCFQVLRESMHILLEGSPKHLDPQKIIQDLLSIDGITGLHDLHIWRISSSDQDVVLTAHIELEVMDRWPHIFEQVKHKLKQDFNISQLTLQPEWTFEKLVNKGNKSKKPCK